MTQSAPKTPRVSVIIPTYNRRDALARALQSVLDQTHTPAEVIVVDDGSTDDTRSFVTELGEQHSSVLYVYQHQQGAAAARNNGLRRATGDLIAFQDSDDAWATTFLERLLPHVAGRPRTVAFSSHRTHHRNGHSVVVPERHVPDPARLIPRTNVISTQTVLADRSIFDEGAAFDPHLRRFQDWDLWLTMLASHRVTFVHVPELLVDLYRMDDSISEGSPRVRDACLRAIARKHVRLFLRRPRALARIALRGYLRPTLQRATAGLWARTRDISGPEAREAK